MLLGGLGWCCGFRTIYNADTASKVCISPEPHWVCYLVTVKRDPV